MKLYHHPNCSTCKKAIAWLNDRGVAYEAIDIRQTPPTKAELRRALEQGLTVRQLFNASGQQYRDRQLKDRLPGMSDDEAVALLASEGMLVKRPFAIEGGKVTAGFKAERYEEIWSG